MTEAPACPVCHAPPPPDSGREQDAPAGPFCRRKAEEDRIRKEEEKARRELIKQEYLRRKQQQILEEQGLGKPKTRPRKPRPKSVHREEPGSDLGPKSASPRKQGRGEGPEVVCGPCPSAPRRPSGCQLPLPFSKVGVEHWHPPVLRGGGPFPPPYRRLVWGTRVSRKRASSCLRQLIT